VVCLLKLIRVTLLKKWSVIDVNRPCVPTHLAVLALKLDLASRIIIGLVCVKCVHALTTQAVFELLQSHLRLRSLASLVDHSLRSTIGIWVVS